ncbi:hypothetical protein MNQ98_09270 [Paenibacillus sp. N3/727]|uniref:hypothetical protein n=1 Tax=Paenibacillus sp. N3/727 TaxID=2925845 RepID=UPI001F52DAD1|nr:hypothetical protein [Paenibacillus sp. N3/727]UNK20177.1 hypothetical protein MNQ98_09270 [Paenibacillus sp. N3/727]
MTLNQYRILADEIGGENGQKILELVNQLEEARGIIAGMKFPRVLGNKEVADALGVDPKNMHHTRKTRFFPDPDFIVGSRPFWFETTIQVYQDKIEEWRNKK